MYMLYVYYHDVLRYTIVASLEQAQELRNQGFHVQIKFAPDKPHVERRRSRRAYHA